MKDGVTKARILRGCDYAVLLVFSVKVKSFYVIIANAHVNTVSVGIDSQYIQVLRMRRTRCWHKEKEKKNENEKLMELTGKRERSCDMCIFFSLSQKMNKKQTKNERKKEAETSTGKLANDEMNAKAQRAIEKRIFSSN